MHHEGSPQAQEGPGEEPSWRFIPFHGIYGSLLSSPFQGLERRLQGVHVRCSVLYSMHHEGSESPGPGRAWGGAFMAFTISWHLQKPPLQGLERRGGFMVFLFDALCYTICTMKAPPQALEGPGEEPSWHLS